MSHNPKRDAGFCYECRCFNGEHSSQCSMPAKGLGLVDNPVKHLNEEERHVVCGVRDLVTLAKINGKYVSGEEYYLHMAKLARSLEGVNLTGQGSS